MIRCALALIVCLLAADAHAGLAPNELADVALAPAPGAGLPLDARLNDGMGETTLRQLLAKRPASLLVFADYTCQSVCGVELAIAAASLADPSLSDIDAGLIVVGLDPKDGREAARKMRAETLGDRNPLAARASFLTADAATIETLTTASGYRYRYDAQTDQFAHPAAVLTVREDGRIGRALAGLSLMPRTLRTALIEAGSGRTGGLIERVMLRCYAFDPATGLYTAGVTTWLRVAGAATLAALGLLVAALARRRSVRREVT